jgi:ectoine hydroxylase-related dioxygenase (phytanoyl-CoA dioxygenase family)
MLNADQVAQYHREGYLVVANFLSAEQLANFRTQMDAVSAGNTLAEHHTERLEMEPNQPPHGTLVRRIYEPCAHYEPFRTFSESDKLLNCVAALLGPDLVLHYSKINMKPAGIGSSVEWHQDLSYYPLTNPDSLSILFYLDDANAANGCLQVVPGQHQNDLLDHTEEGFFQGRVTEEVDESTAVPLEGSAGSVIFMHAVTPHASIANTAKTPRRTLILSYRAADAFPVYVGPMTAKNETYAKLVRGQRPNAARFDGGFFPIPLYKDQVASLYDLQERSRKGQMKT